MHRLVLDTNILVSGLIGKGKPRTILELVLEGEELMMLSSPVFGEYKIVLNRQKFFQYPDFAEHSSHVLRILPLIAIHLEPTTRLNECVDDDDNKFLELAVDSNADFLITGNKRHFPKKTFRGVQIVSPSEFIEQRSNTTSYS